MSFWLSQDDKDSVISPPGMESTNELFNWLISWYVMCTFICTFYVYLFSSLWKRAILTNKMNQVLTVQSRILAAGLKSGVHGIKENLSQFFSHPWAVCKVFLRPPHSCHYFVWRLFFCMFVTAAFLNNALNYLTHWLLILILSTFQANNAIKLGIGEHFSCFFVTLSHLFLRKVLSFCRFIYM